MKLFILHQLFYFVILITVNENYVQGKARIIQVSPNPLYVVSGETARLVWDYTVDNRKEEFQLSSPTWNYNYSNETPVVIGYDHVLRDWKWTISNETCPARLLYPTTRVSRESNATLVISNVTTADSGIYRMNLLMKTLPPIASKIQLLVTTRPKFTIQLQANNKVLEGEDLGINCSATGTPTPNITWVLLKNQAKEIKSQGVGFANLVIQNITRHQNGTYQCQATNNPNEYPVETQTQVTVWYIPNITFLNWTVNEMIIVLLCQASGHPRPLIKWYYGDGTQVESGVTEITGGSRMVLKILDSNTGLYGMYKCNATNEVGWKVGYLNITEIDLPAATKSTGRAAVTVTSKPDTKTKATRIARKSSKPSISSSTSTPTLKKATRIARKSSKPSISTPTLKKAEKSGHENVNYKKNLKNDVLLCVLGVLLPIAITVIVIIVLRKRCKKRINKENKTDVGEDNNTRLHSVLPEASNTVTYAEVKNIPIYAQIDKSKKRTDRQNYNMPVYAQVDMSKKKRPDQIIYAELEDLKEIAATPSAILPPPYNSTEYAALTNLQNQESASHPEPIYESLPEFV